MHSTQRSVMFTGGGSAGHVLPNITLIQALDPSWRVAYLGQRHSVEQRLVERQNIAFFCMAAGKLRRYWSWRHVIEPYKVLLGTCQALWHLGTWRPDLLFAKGGYVAVPAVLAAALLRIPVVIHESDRSPGLANRICAYFAQVACLSVPLPAGHRWHRQLRLEVTGLPIRPELMQGRPECGLARTGLSAHRHTLLVMGGSQGARAINRAVCDVLAALLAHGIQVIHITGPNWPHKHSKSTSYVCYDYVHEGLADLLACSDVVLSRAGANAIAELVALKKPHILVPLGTQSSRGEQWENARFAAQHHGSVVIPEQQLSQQLCEQVLRALQHAGDRQPVASNTDFERPIRQLVRVISSVIQP